MKSIHYPADWPTLAREIKEANNYICQNARCRRQCRRPGELWLGWEYELTIAHVDQDYESDAILLLALCLPCHFRHDAPFSWSARRRAERLRRVLAGQLPLIQ